MLNGLWFSQAAKNFAPTLAQEIKKKTFLNPPGGNMPFKKENDGETIGALQ